MDQFYEKCLYLKTILIKCVRSPQNYETAIDSQNEETSGFDRLAREGEDTEEGVSGIKRRVR